MSNWLYGACLAEEPPQSWRTTALHASMRALALHGAAEDIAKPLGITSFIWHLFPKSAIAQKPFNMSTRQEDGTFIDGLTLIQERYLLAEGGGTAIAHD
jgi:hypothetical protein